MAVINELGGEKIDVTMWEENPQKFIANALSPAKIVKVDVNPPAGGKNTAEVFVPEDQLSLAIGKDGRNVRLAANLTGWKIDIKTTDAVLPEEGEESEEGQDEKPKKTKKTKKSKKGEVGIDGEPEEAGPEEVDAAAEEAPMENPTEENK